MQRRLADAKTKTVTFTAKDETAAKAGFKALIDGGFFGSATSDGKELKAEAPAPPKDEKKTGEVVVKGVHVCWGQCQTGVKNLFKGATVTFEEKGTQRTVRIQQDGITPGAVLEALRKGGFNGTPEK